MSGVLEDDAIPEQPRTRRNHPAPCILECAFKDSVDNACVPRQLAQLLGAPFEEVCGDFDALAEHDWRTHGILPVEIRAFCAWRNAPMVLISNTGEPLDRFEPAQRETKTVVFTYYDGHAFFYRNARPVLEQMGCALVMYRRDPKQTVPPLEERSSWARSSRVTSTRRTYGRRGGSCCSRSTTCRSRSARSRSSRA